MCLVCHLGTGSKQGEKKGLPDDKNLEIPYDLIWNVFFENCRTRRSSKVISKTCWSRDWKKLRFLFIYFNILFYLLFFLLFSALFWRWMRMELRPHFIWFLLLHYYEFSSIVTLQIAPEASNSKKQISETSVGDYDFRGLKWINLVKWFWAIWRRQITLNLYVAFSCYLSIYFFVLDGFLSLEILTLQVNSCTILEITIFDILVFHKILKF